MAADSGLYRQRTLDIDAGDCQGARVTLGFIAPSRTHFDLGYALDGKYLTVPTGGNESPRLHGPWDAVDATGREYEGLGNGGTFGPTKATGVIRFLPNDSGRPFPLLPSPG